MPADPKPRVDKDGLPQRYEPQAHSYGGAWADMLETPDGDWVSWKDYEALAATAARRLDLLGEVWGQFGERSTLYGKPVRHDMALSTLADVQAELTAAGRINEAGMFPGEEG